METPRPIVGNATKADQLKGSESGETVRGLGGNDFIWGLGGDDKLWGGAGRDVLYGGDGADELHGGGGRDVLYGEAGNDELRGGGGNDVLYGGTGHDKLYGDGGNDVLIDKEQRGWGNGELRGGAGEDVLIAAGGQMFGEAGNDILIATGGAQAWGGPGADTLIGPGSGFANVMYIDSDAGVTVNLATGIGEEGHADGDMISGFTGIVGSHHDDTLTGDEKDNFFRGMGGADKYIGGEGNDTVSFARKNPNSDGEEVGVTANLTTGEATGGRAEGDKFETIENLIGSKNNDTLTGNGVRNWLSGEDGDDTLYGMAGNDSLGGGKGTDTLNGGSGADDLSGNEGADTFVFGKESVVNTQSETETRTLEAETDKVWDFSRSDGDKLDLRDLKNHSLFTGGTTPGTLSLRETEGATFTGVKGQVKWWQDGEDTSTEDDDVTHVQVDLNGDGNANFQVDLAGLHTVTDADLILA